MSSSITIKEIEKPLDPDIIADITWLCKSFGFVSPRDMEETTRKIFHAIVFAAKTGEELTSEKIALMSDITRGTALFHIKNYINSGLVIQKKTKYVLRKKSIGGTVEEIQMDSWRMFQDIKKIAKEVDERLGLFER